MGDQQYPETITSEALSRICERYGLGPVLKVERPERGIINHTLILNDHFVIRFDLLTTKGRSRFESEAMAYAVLGDSPVPVPRVAMLDRSRLIVPYDYLVTTKVPGMPVVDAWPSLTEQQREEAAYWSGKYLAIIHNHTFPRFGKLRELETVGFPTWSSYVHDYFQRYAKQALELGVLDADAIERVDTVLSKYRPILDGVKTASLIHSDYHFENILAVDGRVSGIIDFEWAFAGDPVADFAVDDKWDEMCPGSATLVYKGYMSERDLDPDHELKVGIYKMVGHVESIVDKAEQATRRGANASST